MTDWVYFIKNPMTGLVKVGFSGDIARRLSELSKQEGCSLELLDCVPGGRLMERRFHESMRAFRDHGEWFKPNSLMQAWLNFFHEVRTTDEATMDARCKARGYRLAPAGAAIPLCDVFAVIGDGFWQGWEGF